MSALDQDLNKIIYEMVEDVISIDRPNKEKICNFVVNLVLNGGRKEQAALDAGYSKATAASEAYRLLNDAKINAIYERFLAHRFVTGIFRKTLSKEHLVNLCYQIAQRNFYSEKTQSVAVKAIEQICKIMGYYEPIETKNIQDYGDLLEQLSKIPMIAKAFEEGQKETIQ